MRLTINHYTHSKSTVVNLSYVHAQTDLHELASFSFSTSPVGVECGSAVLHVVGAQVEASLTLGDSRQNSGIYCKPFHGDLTTLTAAAQAINVIGCYGNVGVAGSPGCSVNFDPQRHVTCFQGRELLVMVIMGRLSVLCVFVLLVGPALSCQPPDCDHEDCGTCCELIE